MIRLKKGKNSKQTLSTMPRLSMKKFLIKIEISAIKFLHIQPLQLVMFSEFTD